MNDNNTDGDLTAAGSPRRRTVAVAAAVGVAGLLAGGLAAGTLSAASADTSNSGERPGYGGVQRDVYGARPPAGEGEGGPTGRMGGDCPEGADGAGGGGETGEGRPPAPDSPPSTEDSSYMES